MSYCKYLSKKIDGNLRCKLFRQQITLLKCKNCSKFILTHHSTIKRVSAKREFVKKEIYNKVYKRDKGKCRLCERTDIQLHHIRYRSEAKYLINEPSNCIMLCEEHHRLVHSNKHYWQPKLLELVKENKND